MKRTFINDVWDAVRGKVQPTDSAILNKVFCDSLIGSLSEGIYDELHIWTDNPRLEEDLDKDYLLDRLITQGGAKRRFAERLRAGGVYFHDGEPAGEMDARQIDGIKCNVWYTLCREAVTPRTLHLSGAGISATLTPDHTRDNPYILGRGTETGIRSTMITVPDETGSISRNQAKLFFEKGKWYCTPLSPWCGTFIPREGGDYVAPNQTVLLVEKKKPVNTMTFENDSVAVSLMCELGEE